MRLPARVKRLIAQLLLQRRHLPPERGLRQAKGACGGGEGAGLGRHHGGAGAVPVEGGVLPIHAKTYAYSANFGNFSTHSAWIYRIQRKMESRWR
jgi:hypothetical protein